MGPRSRGQARGGRRRPQCLTCGRAAGGGGGSPAHAAIGNSNTNGPKVQTSQFAAFPLYPGQGQEEREEEERGRPGVHHPPPRPGSFLLLPQALFSCKRGFPPSWTHTHISPQLPAPSTPGAPRCGRFCQARGRHDPAGLAPLPLPGDFSPERCPCPLHRVSPSSLEAAARPLGAAPARQSSLPMSPPPRTAGSPLPPFLLAAPGAGRRPPAPYLGCRCRLSPRRAAHPSCAPPAAGSGASPGRLWAWRGQGARLGTERSGRFSPAARPQPDGARALRCRPGERDRTQRAEPLRRGEGKGRGGEGRGWGGGGKFHKVE